MSRYPKGALAEADYLGLQAIRLRPTEAGSAWRDGTASSMSSGLRSQVVAVLTPDQLRAAPARVAGQYARGKIVLQTRE